MKIDYFKLVSGEDLVGEFVTDIPEENSIVYKNILYMNLAPTDTGQIGIQFLPFPFAIVEGSNVIFNKSCISVFGEPNEHFLGAYREKFGSIQVVKNPGIIVP